MSDSPLHDPLPVSEIRKIERRGLDKGLPLMHRAGKCAAEFALKHCKPLSHAWLLVGPGNNGADALTAGIELLAAGVSVTAIMPAPMAPVASDANDALAHWISLGITTRTDLPLCEQDPGQSKTVDLVIDGLFGIGLNRPLEDPWQALIDQVNALQLPVLSLDIPSGVSADTGHALGRPIRARWTVAFIAPSLALYDSRSNEFAGEWDVCTLGLERE